MACLRIACQHNRCPYCEGRGWFVINYGGNIGCQEDCEHCNGTAMARCVKPTATTRGRDCCNMADRNMDGWCTCCGDPPY